MDKAGGIEATTFDVRAADGTSIAVWVRGTGPALVMVHGSIADHTTFDSFVAVLGDHFTTFSMDRRGFGASGDAEEYAIERDFEDVAAVVDDVAVRTGESGRRCSATPTVPTARSVVPPSPATSITSCSTSRASACSTRRARSTTWTRRSRAARTSACMVAILTEFVGMTEAEIDAMRSSSVWPARLAAAHTIPRECRAEQDWVDTPGQFDAVTAPTLLLAGTETRSPRSPR